MYKINDIRGKNAPVCSFIQKHNELAFFIYPLNIRLFQLTTSPCVHCAHFLRTVIDGHIEQNHAHVLVAKRDVLCLQIQFTEFPVRLLQRQGREKKKDKRLEFYSYHG